MGTRLLLAKELSSYIVVTKKSLRMLVVENEDDIPRQCWGIPCIDSRSFRREFSKTIFISRFIAIDSVRIDIVCYCSIFI